MSVPPSGIEVVRRLSFLCVALATVCLPLMALLGSDDAPAAVVPVYLVSLSGLLGWCLACLRSEEVLVRWALAVAITSAVFVCFVYITVVTDHLRNRRGIVEAVLERAPS